MANKDSLSVSQFLKSMFGVSNNEEAIIRKANPLGITADCDPDEIVEDCCALQFSYFVDALTDYWMSQLPNNSRSKSSQWAANYRDAQIAQVNRLYRHIYKSMLQASGGIYQNNSGTLFQLLERLYTAVEELALPFPRNFHSTFASLGFKCLPRGTFLQFVDRGVIILTPTFLRELLAMPTEDWDFRLQLLLRLRDANKSFELIQQVDYTPPQLLLENAISALPQCMVNSDSEGDMHSFVDMEIYNNSAFIPLSALLGFINSKVSLPPITPTSPASNSPSSSLSFVSVGPQSNDALLTFINANFSKIFKSFSDLS